MEIEAIRREMRRISKLMREHPEGVQAKRRAIKNDPSLTAEQRKYKLDELAATGRAQHLVLAEKWERMNEKADAEGRKTRGRMPVDEAAAVRVRDLIKGGMADDLIIKKAIELGDDDMLEALRRERLWHNNGKTFHPADDTVAACDRALADVGRGEGLRSMNQALVDIAEIRKPMETVIEYSGKVALDADKPYDTLRVAYATGEGYVRSNERKRAPVGAEEIDEFVDLVEAF